MKKSGHGKKGVCGVLEVMIPSAAGLKVRVTALINRYDIVEGGCHGIERVIRKCVIQCGLHLL